MVAHVKAGDTFALLSNKGRRRTGLVVDVIGRDHICVAIFNTLDSSLIENGTLSPDIVAWTNPFFLKEKPPADVTKWNLNGYLDMDLKRFYPVYRVRSGGAYKFSMLLSKRSNPIPDDLANRYYNLSIVSPAAIPLMVDQLEDGDLHPNLAGAVYSPERMGYKVLALFEQYSK